MKAALIGQNIGGSLTPDMHMAEAKAQGISYDYCRFDTATAPYDAMPLKDILRQAEADGMAGVNVTHPFKVDAAGLMHDLSETAQALGAVNTVLFENGRRIGHNTDYVGFRSALRSEMPMASIAKVMLVGAGGAGGAVALALIDQGCGTLCVTDLSTDRAEALATRLKAARPRADIQVARDFESAEPTSLSGVVNATPVGMDAHPGVSFDPDRLAPACWVADIIYFPRQTELLKRSASRRLRTMDGSGMAIFQAAAAFHLITGQTASPERMTAQFKHLVSQERKEMA
ncbi:Quinate/shikimate dehydrogenase (NAD(+)) [Aliiroseovarius pelagivivens]|uniref:Quinate/shikimate dehydrogenase (NAD(+)) n=1 Tax=Aliiroseovarius pelagivivens TaxID=1639690 RepID=A0A2R8AMC5_9RHOB|nr:shikimate dehydrogenase [Aliiroseovarius pelagivivens]SPF77203.1 Quinate/shikimate dehydrogenase (NAD(+)) [Aliiroseovarius pelagivivens]